MDDETFEALARIEGRLDGLREAFLGLITQLTYRDRSLSQPLETQMFGSVVERSDKNPHAAMMDELRDIGNKITALREAREADAQPF